MRSKAYIIFTREPVAGRTKTRMMPYLKPEECAELHVCFLKDFSRMIEDVDADVFVYYYSEDGDFSTVRECFGDRVSYRPQSDGDIGRKMYYAITEVLDKGYASCVLTGSDIPELTADSVNYAFACLDNADAVVGRTADGGYHLIGMKEACEAPFTLEGYADDSVYNRTVAALEGAGLKVMAGHEYSDMDRPEDLRGFRQRMLKDERLAASHTGRFICRMLKISIIVPVYNERSMIESIQNQLRPYKEEAEIIFVDGGSTDGTVSMISDEFAALTSCKGRAKQMNEGARASSGDVLFFLHCDSVIPDDITGQIREVMRTSRYGCFGIRFDSRNPFMLTNRLISNHRAWKRGIPFGDQGIFIDKELFFEMGGFPDIPIMEDYQFSLNLKSRGYMPGRTRDTITTSTRRFGKGIVPVLLTEYRMWKLRSDYRRGADINSIAKSYKDIR